MQSYNPAIPKNDTFWRLILLHSHLKMKDYKQRQAGYLAQAGYFKYLGRPNSM